MKRQKKGERNPKNSSELLEPAILFRTLKDLDHLSKNQASFITNKLSEYLQSYMINTIGSVSDLMSRNIQQIVTKVNYKELREADLLVVIREKILAEVKNSNNKKIIKEAEEIERRLVDMPSPKIADLLHLDILLRVNPIFGPDIRRAKIIEYVRLAEIDDEIAKILADRNPLYFDDTDDTILSNLVRDEVINEDQKQRLLLVSSLSKLTGDNLQLMKALKTQELKSTAEFVGWEVDDWLKLIKDERISLPPNETIETYAGNILFNIKRTYPSQFLVNRFTEKNDDRDKINLLDSLNTLLENHNDKLIDGNGIVRPANIDWTGVSAETREKMQKDLEQLAVFANRYHQLGLATLINNKELNLATKKQTISSRLRLIKKFFTDNPELDLRYVNFFDTKNSSINREGIPVTDKPMIRKQVMAFQRILNIVKDPEDSITLLSKGYDSVMAISEKSENEFIQTSGLPLGKARLTYANAQRYSEVVAHSYETIRDALNGQFKDIRMANISTKKLANELQEIDGFTELFGPQNFCGCSECMSILSPAAYLVDLMRFIDTNVSQQIFAPPNDYHPLCLRERRKDLWELELTCENTHTLIPYLTIVNKVLERYLKHILSHEDIYEKFSEDSLLTKVSFFLPFNLPLEELRIYLNHFDTSLYEIYKVLKLPDQKIWRARMNLSKEEFTVIATQETPIGNIKFRFGDPPSFTDFLLQDFVRFADISREQLNQLLSIKFNPDLGNIEISRKADPDADDILQNFKEVLNHLSSQRLDFIHRFIRLWRKTTWSIPELDLVLTSLRDANLISSDLDEVAVILVAKLMNIQEKLKLDVEELCALFHFLPVSQDYPQPHDNEKDKMLFERLFDPRKLFGVDPTTGSINSSTPPDNPYHHYSLNKDDPDDETIDPRTPLLLSGLSISESELILHFDLLKNEIDLGSNGNCTLNREKISLLYRHAKLARALKLSIEDFIVALLLNFGPGNSVITVRDLDQVFKLLEFREWIKNTPFNISELYYILHGEESGTTKSSMTLDNVATLVFEMKSQDPSIEIKIDDLKTRLLTLFNFSPDQLKAISNKWLTKDINDNATADTSIKTALNTIFTPEGAPTNPQELVPLVDLLNEIERILLLFTNLKFKEETIHNITTKQQLLGIGNLKHLTLKDIILLSAYKKHITLADNDDKVESLMQSVLQSYSTNNNIFSPNDIDTLTKLWKKDESLIRSLVKSLVFSTIPIEAIDYLWKCLGICNILGFNGFSLTKLGEDNNYEDLLSARDIALGAFSSKYDNEKIRDEKLEPYRDRINVLKRDIICKYILARQTDLKFKDLNDIYSYFLLDVEMGSCFRTSRLVCAISSLQLYVHRCLVNLEQSADGDINVDPSRIPADEWEWRKNYRVWEANRKVFLYPENYLLPDLRDNKTPIFKELEEELLQQKITKESAEADYRKYVSQFAELARLKTVGSYYHDEYGKSTYYFFGCNQQDPPQYYYRELIDNKVWMPWERIDLSIESDRVSAIIHLGKLYLFWISSTTTTKTDASNINNIKTAYNHTKQLVYSFLNEQGKWIPPQKLFFASKESDQEFPAPSKIVFPLVTSEGIFVVAFDNVQDHPILVRKIDLFMNLLRSPAAVIKGLVPADTDLLRIATNMAYKATLITWRVQNQHESQIEDFLSAPWPSVNTPGGISITSEFSPFDPLYPELHLVGYRPGDFIFKFGDQQYLIQRQYGTHIDPNGPGTINPGNFFLNTSARITNANASNIKTNNIPSAMFSLLILPGDPLSKRYMLRLSTSLTNDLGEILFTRGLEEFLSLTTQRKKEYPIGIDFVEPSELLGPYNGIDHIDLKGAYGTYYQELFFHIPFLIANHLNATQRFKESKWWYERIFNPTADEPNTASPSPSPSPSPSSSSLDRVWQYIDFREVTIQKMRDILTDRAAIQMYEKDPFNPHTIARLRSNAYQKAIVMRYIDNLIDWGDHLFAQDTMESINEATMLYVLASDILGKRPVEIGTCEIAMGTKQPEGVEEIECTAPLTYEKIEACSIDTGTDFLIELENWHYTGMTESMIGASINNSPAISNGSNIDSVGGLVANNLAHFKPKYDLIHQAEVQKEMEYSDQVINQWENVTDIAIKKFPAASMIVKPAMLAFCIPPNKDLIAYWDRVEDRLFKIRNCMNISGIRRQLALFQPPINPMELVRARAAGLILEDIPIPGLKLSPYRFNYLIEKAKQYTQTLQNFGSALLSALEKKDVEELTLLRSVHERSILNMTKEIRNKQVEESQKQYEAAKENITNIQNRINHYAGLIESGLSKAEVLQVKSKSIANLGGFEKSAQLLKYASILYLLPQIGSAFAMKYGGQEKGNSMKSAAETFSALAQIAGSISESAGLEASFTRREQEWKHQLLLAQRELEQGGKQALAAEIRASISDKERSLHLKSIEQAKELDEFYKNKFTKLGLYDYLSTSLNRLYREAYQLAYNMAKMAERTYKFETDDDRPFIANDNWQLDNAGLLAGERLLLQLQRMETAYIENNKRNYEVTQTFSLAMLNPDALMKLRQNGNTDEFHIPEVAYELVYPGGYCRFIKDVATTVHLVKGPNINTGAKLTLHSSKVRKDKSPNKVLDEFPEQDSVLIPLTERDNTSIMTTHGINDSGIIERNPEKYLPFEGSGAISTWSLKLPETIHSFPYGTISDVLIHVTYTFKEDEQMREAVEQKFKDELSAIASSIGLFRLISLKHEFPNSFHQLLHPSTGQPQITEFDLERKHFPYFIAEKELVLSPSARVRVFLKPRLRDREIETSGLILNVNNSPVGPWESFDESNMEVSEVSITGTPIRKWAINAEGLDKERIDDVLILLTYTAS